MRKALVSSVVVLAALSSFASAAAKGKAGKETLPVYKPTSGVTGTLKSIGSDSMNNEMALWSEAFRKFYPGVKIEVEGKGSATAPTALIEGTAQFGPMSRPMKNEEISAFKAKFGYDPTPVKTSLDVLAVYVHRDNPIKSLSLQDVDAIFSKTRKSGAKKDIATWGDLGLTGEWANKPIQLYGRNSASGTYGYFKENALAKGDLKDTVKEQPGSAAVVQGVATDKFGIGYSGIGYKTDGVKAVALSLKPGSEVVPATEENALAGKYPLGRYLLIYINKAPKQDLDPARREFLMYVLSAAGQEAVVKNGYIALPLKVLQEERVKLGVVKGG
ncbi:MAG: PstS family phosphate ABC transporter substrate-binding protein [Betaproteobacteria bacterium]|nr:PstS family phosphate ABC transporter substrate-binding protein [Betaproteobacteria bacterium]